MSLAYDETTSTVVPVERYYFAGRHSRPPRRDGNDRTPTSEVWTAVNCNAASFVPRLSKNICPVSNFTLSLEILA